MGKLYGHITDRLEAFIERQHVFFVATAPLEEGGHVNASPKGQDTFAILDPHTVAYLDFSGSGAETIAHVKQNRRITIMFCAFEGPPFILRLYGRARCWNPTIQTSRRSTSASAASSACAPSFASVLRASRIPVASVCPSTNS